MISKLILASILFTVGVALEAIQVATVGIASIKGIKIWTVKDMKHAKKNKKKA